MKHNLFILMVALLVLAAPQPALAQTGPATSLVSYPVTLGISRLDASTFAFTSSVTSFECSLDDAAFADCASPVSYEVLPGIHTFKVHTITGGVAGSDASHTWTVGPYEPWSREVIKKESELSLATAIALHTNGSAHILYATYSQIVYARWDPATNSWATQVVDTIEGDVCGDISLALDTQGRPHAAYCQYASGIQKGLYYATSDGTSWIKTLVDPAVGYALNGQYNSLAVDASGHPHISYYQQSVGLRYAAYDGSNWNKETVDATCTGSPAQCAGYRGTSLALDAWGKPRISYYDWVDRDLEYAAWSGFAWDFHTVDSFGDVGTYPSLKLDASGNPRVSYLSMADSYSARDVRYAAWNETGWDRQVIAPAALAPTSLALDPLGRTHISYKKASGDPEYAVSDGQAWRTEQVTTWESAPTTGAAWLALDAQGRAYISVANRSWEMYVYEKGLAGSLRATHVLSGSSYPKDAQLQVCLSGGTIGDTADCKMATGNGGTVEWQGLMPGSDYTVSAPSVADWTGQADQAGLAVVSGARTEVNAGFAYSGTALPDTGITGRPMFDRITTSPSASFEFDSSQTESTFECSLDGASFADCATPYTSASLAPGVHTFTVRAKNSRSAVDPSPVEFTWKIDPTSPWQLATLNTSDSFPSVDLALDNAGLPRLVSGQQGVGWYTPWTGRVWASSPMPEGFEQSLAIDASGRTHIAYRGRNGGLYYGVWNRSGWDTELVSGNGGRPDLALDASGKPHIAFADGSIKYATRDETDWQHKAWKIEAAASEQDSYPSLALDASGNPSIAFLDYYQTVKYTSRTSSGWSTEIVGAVAGVMDSSQVSLALAGDGQPRIAYCDAGLSVASTLYYAVRSGGTWSSQAAASWAHRNGCLYPSLALDGAGHPHIASYEWNAGTTVTHAPHYTAWTGTAWVTKPIETLNPQSATDISLVLDALSRPNIVYVDLAGGANGAFGPIVYALGEADSQQTATVTLGSLEQTYDGHPKAVTVTTDPAGLTVDVTYEGSATSPTNAGEYAVVATIDDPVYQGTASGTLVIHKANQTITIGALSNKTYGDADFDPGATASSSLDVSYHATGNCSIQSGQVHINGAGSCTVTASQGGDTNYNAAPDVSQSFSIAQTSSTTIVTVADATYDGDLHGGTAVVTGAGGLNQSLTVSYSGRDGTIYGPSTTTPTNAGDYTASASFSGDANHTGSSDSKDYSIAKANAVISVTPYDVTYDGNSHTATGMASGVESPTPAALTSLLRLSGTTQTNAGDYPEDQWTFDGNGNYNAANGTVYDSISKLTVTASITAADKVYDGTTDAAITDCLLSGVISGDSVSCTASSASFANKNAGTDKTVTAMSITLGGTDAGNYRVNSTATTTADITPAQLTVKADDKSKGYGEPLPEFTVTYSGFVNGEDQSVLSGAPSLSTTATADSPVGAYPITVAAGSLSTTNYTFTFANGTLAISKPDTTITLTTSSSSAIFHQPVTFTAVVAPVAPATGLPVGNVNFIEGTTTLAANVLLVDGQAQFTTSDLAAGPHAITAVYSGDTNWNGSTESAVGVGITYKFVGFTSPVDNPPTYNIAKAGQIIPLKWRVLDFYDAPVANLTSVTVTAVSRSCPAGTTTDQIEEYATGGTGLQNLGDGYYQWKWKSPSNYANSCKTLKLDIGEGAGNEHTALFQFRR